MYAALLLAIGMELLASMGTFGALVAQNLYTRSAAGWDIILDWSAVYTYAVSILSIVACICLAIAAAVGAMPGKKRCCARIFTSVGIFVVAFVFSILYVVIAGVAYRNPLPMKYPCNIFRHLQGSLVRLGLVSGKSLIDVGGLLVGICQSSKAFLILAGISLGFWILILVLACGSMATGLDPPSKKKKGGSSYSSHRSISSYISRISGRSRSENQTNQKMTERGMEAGGKQQEMAMPQPQVCNHIYAAGQQPHPHPPVVAPVAPIAPATTLKQQPVAQPIHAYVTPGQTNAPLTRSVGKKQRKNINAAAAIANTTHFCEQCQAYYPVTPVSGNGENRVKPKVFYHASKNLKQQERSVLAHPSNAFSPNAYTPEGVPIQPVISSSSASQTRDREVQEKEREHNAANYNRHIDGDNGSVSEVDAYEEDGDDELESENEYSHGHPHLQHAHHVHHENETAVYDNGTFAIPSEDPNYHVEHHYLQTSTPHTHSHHSSSGSQGSKRQRIRNLLGNRESGRNS